MNFEQTSEFQKDLKRLAKKWRSLPEDVGDVQLQINDLYSDAEGAAEYRAAFFNGKRAAILHSTETVEIVKMRLDVAALGTNDTVRIVFVAVRNADTVTFIELFAKNEKPREDKGRIKEYL